jgi:acid phosphatase
MPAFALLAAVLAGCASTHAPAPDGAPPPAGAAAARPATPAPAAALRDTHEQLQGALWVQTSVEYRMVCETVYRAAAAALAPALADGAWTAAIEQAGDASALPPAVVLDIDETVLDNSLFQGELARRRLVYTPALWREWVAQRRAGLVPGAAAFLAAARASGAAVVFVTNRTAAEEADTIANLAALGVEVAPEDVLCAGENDWPSEKSARRRAVAERYRIVLLVGDDLGDFMPARLSPAERAAAAHGHAAWWGRRWFVLPNPMYGSWERALLGFEPLPDAQSLSRKLSLVKGFTN